MKDKTNELLTKANDRLSQANVGIRIERKGQALYLRGMLPPKPGSTSNKPYQQRIPLSRLGIRANPIGVKQAENEAKKIGGQVATKDFSWNPYQSAESKPTRISDWISKFEEYYFQCRPRNPKTQTTWKGDYQAVYNHLPQEKPLTLEIIREIILTKTPNSKQRSRYARALKALGKFAEIDCSSLSRLAGSYSSSKAKERNVPEDLLIAETALLIPNPEWQWAYQLMATYGLRPHEIFHVEFSQFPILKVTQGKTGPRIVYPFHPEWANEWNLQDMKIPKCSGASDRDLGSRVGKAFDRYSVPFNPYDLRHAYANRTIHYGLDISLAAHYMGHSVKMHCDEYRKWLTEETHRKAQAEILANPHRPLPPVISHLPRSCLEISEEIACNSRN